MTLASFGMRLAFVLLFSCGLASAWASDPPPMPDLSSYGQIKGFRSYLNRQTNTAEHVRHILVISEFSRAGLVADEYKLSDQGTQLHTSWTISPGIGVGYGFSPKLPEAQLREVTSAIRELPPTNALPPVDELVLVSFHRGTNWITRSYDKRSLPAPMGRIHDIRQNKWVPSFTVQ